MEKLNVEYCPKCGSENINKQELIDTNTDYLEYDVYCEDCGWSGDISPDQWIPQPGDCFIDEDGKHLVILEKNDKIYYTNEDSGYMKINSMGRFDFRGMDIEKVESERVYENWDDFKNNFDIK